ncbi:MAG TPA: GTPase domain-containing protein [Longimicrobiaceae bacterium]|nr:GTPase domain-containing protein [Longimicrobium sp.]
MSLVNYSTREITCKIVYYGPGRSGKTTNLQHIHGLLPEATRGRIVSLATEMDRTLFFDFLPVDLGTISGFQVRIQLYTVPGQVYYDATRRLVLQGADGVVFVADSQPSRQEENVESFRNLQENLLKQGVDPRAVPVCIQYNKRDLPEAIAVAEMERTLNYRGDPSLEASAAMGEGVVETLRCVSELVLARLATRLQSPASVVT